MIRTCKCQHTLLSFASVTRWEGHAELSLSDIHVCLSLMVKLNAVTNISRTSVV